MQKGSAAARGRDVLVLASRGRRQLFQERERNQVQANAMDSNLAPAVPLPDGSQQPVRIVDLSSWMKTSGWIRAYFAAAFSLAALCLAIFFFAAGGMAAS